MKFITLLLNVNYWRNSNNIIITDIFNIIFLYVLKVQSRSKSNLLSSSNLELSSIEWTLPRNIWLYSGIPGRSHYNSQCPMNQGSPNCRAAYDALSSRTRLFTLWLRLSGFFSSSTTSDGLSLEEKWANQNRVFYPVTAFIVLWSILFPSLLVIIFW